MTRVQLDVANVAADQAVEVPDQTGVVIGRAPDPQRVEAPVDLKPCAVSSPGVSANHLAVWSSGTEVTVIDLGSRHGSWLRLPRDKRVRLEAGDVVQVALGDGSGDAPKLGRLEAARWTNSKDFGEGLTRSIQEWLGELGVAAKVTHQERRKSESPPDHPGRLPLENGEELGIVSEQTTSPHWHETLREVWRFVQRENERLRSEDATRADGTILASDEIRRAHARVVEAARRGARLMVMGESGVGKEGLARVYHRHTGRSGAFIPRNCSMLTRELARAELFGAESGAFTGATRRSIGAVERAHGGTLFLDEVGDMPAEVQPMLLRFLDRGEFERLGDYGGTRNSDACIVSATNRDQREALQQRSFRADLWYRLSNELVEVPPLRERPADIMAMLATRPARTGVPAIELLEKDAVDLLMTHQWSGNFRELESFIARLDGQRADARKCSELLARGTLEAVPQGAAPSGTTGAVGWGEVFERAVVAFGDDFGHVPENWDEVKELIEKYLKPIVFVRLGADGGALPSDADVRALSQKLGADRGTVAKQLQRYRERFSR
ncbi:MAG: sigma 54-interacting transcriptional regulator [Myxococcaceae bacterium]|nr:sigma 54-interacting transcriptional regulator [Myxococcaceae bacterium]